MVLVLEVWHGIGGMVWYWRGVTYGHMTRE